MIISPVVRSCWMLVALLLTAGCGDSARTPAPPVVACSTMNLGCSCGKGILGDGSEICSAQSIVKETGQQGFCCQTEFVCQCRLRECVYVAESSYCLCGTPQAPLGAVRVNDCSQALSMSGLTCCLSSFGCMCSTSPCGDPSEMVPGCSLNDVTACDPSQQTVAACI